MKKEYKSGLLWALVALISWGIHGPAGHYLATCGVDMLFVTAARLGIGTLVFAAFLAFKKGGFNVPVKIGWKQMLILSLIGLYGNTVFYHLALKYLPGTLVMLLENLFPLFVMLLAFLHHRQKPRPVELVALVLSFAGIWFIVQGRAGFNLEGGNFFLGLVLGLTTAFTFAAYNFYSAASVAPLAGNVQAIMAMLFRMFLISFICSLPFLYTPNLPHNFNEWFWLVEMGLFQSGLSYIAWNMALARLPVNVAGVLFLSTVLFTAINEVLFLSLPLTLSLVAGGALIMLAGGLVTGSLNGKAQ